MGSRVDVGHGSRRRPPRAHTGRRGLEELDRAREAFTPDDMLAVAFHGLARRKVRGSMQPGKKVKDLAANLRGLADALEAFNNYRPGTFFADEVRESRRKRDEEQS